MSANRVLDPDDAELVWAGVCPECGQVSLEDAPRSGRPFIRCMRCDFAVEVHTPLNVPAEKASRAS
jgi:hypothetical protein